MNNQNPIPGFFKTAVGLAFLAEPGRWLVFSALAHGALIATLCMTVGNARPDIHPLSEIVMVIPTPDPDAAPVAPHIPSPKEPLPVPPPAIETVVKEKASIPEHLAAPSVLPTPVEPSVAFVSPPIDRVEVAAETTVLPRVEAAVPSVEPIVFVPPRLVPGQNLEPEYPYGARRAGHEGVVLLRVKISETGSVAASSVAAGCGDASLDASALSAVHAWKFIPARRGSDPVASEIELPIRFTLHSR